MAFIIAFLSKDVILILQTWVFCVDVCLCTTCMPGARGGQRSESDTLGLELQIMVNHGVWVFGIELGSCGREAALSYLSGP